MKNYNTPKFHVTKGKNNRRVFGPASKAACGAYLKVCQTNHPDKNWNIAQAKAMNEDTSLDNIGFNSQQFFTDDTSPVEMPSGVFRDFSKWIDSFDGKDVPNEPPFLIRLETRLNFYGYTAFIEPNNAELDDTNEVLAIYTYATHDLVHNAVIDLSWSDSDDDERTFISCNLRQLEAGESIYDAIGDND